MNILEFQIQQCHRKAFLNDYFSETTIIAQTVHLVICVKGPNPAVVKWVGILSPASLFSQEHSYLTKKLDFHYL